MSDHETAFPYKACEGMSMWDWYFGQALNGVAANRDGDLGVDAVEYAGELADLAMQYRRLRHEKRD